MLQHVQQRIWCAVHRGLVLQVVFSPRELKVITAGDDSEVRIWDLTNKACVATLKACLLSSCLHCPALCQSSATVHSIWMRTPTSC